MIVAITQVSSSSSQAAQAAAQGPSQEVGKDAFLKLLLAQLRNQDPLDPTDAKEFVTQLSQLASVEQLMTIVDRISALEVATAGIANAQVADLTGRTVTANVSTIRLGESGPGQAVFQLDGRAQAVTVTIRDEAGQVVRTIRLGDSYPGAHAIEWDGNDDAGTRMPAGRYSIEVAATDDAGRPVSTSTRITGPVTGVSYENGYPELMVGEARVMLGDVVSISM
jgi:flagellar basal-body rod modification protein FlgD